MNHNGRLRKALENTGHDLKDVTVLAVNNDPFRVDSPARHREGQWLAKLGIERLHNRGIHYALLGQKKPNGNTCRARGPKGRSPLRSLAPAGCRRRFPRKGSEAPKAGSPGQVALIRYALKRDLA